MKVVLFGSTGMIGQGVLRECLLDPSVSEVLAPVRALTGKEDPKLREVVHSDYFDLSPLDFSSYDACLFCLGVSSAGMSEADYRRITYDLTWAVAQAYLKQRPSGRFIYISGASTDSTEKGRAMWARVKGQIENALLKLPFDSYMFRPGFIQPMHGIKSKTLGYRVVYSIATPLFPLIKRLAPKSVMTTEQLGRAMVRVARSGADKKVLEASDLIALAG